MDTLGQAEAVPGTLDQVWQALRAVYQELGLRANEVDPRARRVGVRAQRLTRDAGGTRLSVYLDCGSGLTDDLRQMANAIGHDLQQPMTAAAGHAYALSRRLAGGDEETEQIAARLTHSIRMAQEMPTGLLEYAILTRLKQKLGGER